MQITRVWTTDKEQRDTDPFPRGMNKFYLAFFKGDIAHPTGKGNWFKEPIFKKCIRANTKFPLPHFAYWFGGEMKMVDKEGNVVPDGTAGAVPMRKGGLRGYISLAKVWGMDETNPQSGIYDQFRNWLKPEDVYPGSTAMMFSIRNGTSVVILAAFLYALFAAPWYLYKYYDVLKTIISAVF